MSTKKITLVMGMDREPVWNALMSKMNYREVDRVATGGMMSQEQLMITYEGSEEDYTEDLYVELKEGGGDYSQYFSLRIGGFHTDEFEKFKTAHEDNKMQYEVKSFNDQRHD